MVERAQLYLTPLAAQEALAAVQAIQLQPSAANVARVASSNAHLGDNGLHIVISGATEVPAFSVNGTVPEFIAATDIRDADPQFMPRDVLAKADIISMRPSDWSAGELGLELLDAAQAKSRAELRERSIMALTLGYIGLAGAVVSSTVEQWPVIAGLASVSVGAIAWAAKLIHRNRRASQDLDARHWAARELDVPFTVEPLKQANEK